MNYAVILSGGTGSRMEGTEVPKQYVKVNNKMVISYCMSVILKTACLDAFVIAADSAWHSDIWKELHRLESTGQKLRQRFLGFSVPGENRQLSIFHALEFLDAYAVDSDLVLIHDAARPLVTEKQLEDCIHAAQQADGCMPVLPMKDTVYYSSSGRSIDSLLNRECIFAGQAPEVFVFGKYYRANQRLGWEEMLAVNGSTEPAVKAGMNISMIPGEETNFKITTIDDLRRFEQEIGG